MLATAWFVVLVLLMLHESRKAGKTVTPQELSNLVNRDDGLVVDIRDHGEYSRGHIPGSINIPSAELVKRSVEIKDHREKPVIVVCKMGQSASSASKELKAQGFSVVYRLGGGLSEWSAMNLPLVKK